MQPGGSVGSLNFAQRPLLVFWETTRACALACRHCRASAVLQPLPDELTTAEGTALIDEISRFGEPNPILILTGGDCLMRRDVLTLLDHAADLGVRVALSPSVTPRLTPALLDQVRARGVRAMSISLDGAVAETHEAIRGVDGHFEATLRAAGTLAAQGFAVQINTTVMRRNVEELADVCALLRRTGVRIWEVFFLVAVGRGTNCEEISPNEHEDVCHFLVDASRFGIVVRTVEAPFFRRVATQRRAYHGDDVAGAFALGPLYARLSGRLRQLLWAPAGGVAAPSVATRDGNGIVFVAYNGDVHPSGFLPLSLGNVRSAPLVEIYRRHPLLRAIRRAEFSGRCRRCAFAAICGGSRARAYARYGDPLASDPACAYAG
ncbi:MAG TPA: TIGR04053 family radical SAM/SPASM domain-containing protein [bacterium]|nr:TIGR04053 family radical SAM/SPASM domain-containing protein [bacterium]